MMAAIHNRTVFSTTVPVVRPYAPLAAHAPLYTSILAFLAACPTPCSFAILSERFAQQVGGVTPSKNLRNRIEYLVETGLVDASGAKSKRRYSRSSRPVPTPELISAEPAVKPAPRARQAVASKYIGALVPPRQYNVLQGTYQPPRAPSLRAGAQDFARLPSRGVAC